VHGLDLVAGLEPLGERLRVLHVALHAQRQRLDALQEQEALNGLMAAPTSRRNWMRSLAANEPWPSASQ
jgi:hypothetical protein